MSWATLDPGLRDALKQRLTQKQLDVLILRLAGCSLEQVADMLGVSIRTVRTHEHRALQVKSLIQNETKEAA